ncbi:PQQ-dependent catabolism-associated CXXCW motif protein [Xanthobacter sp. V4C-4]|uniref:PQQ-dependent catabolism-associated CXXCW motif protein n=1 Tax=Xanthobacter cornucopiae TaxID=3119924 RepID=UPI00372865C9
MAAALAASALGGPLDAAHAAEPAAAGGASPGEPAGYRFEPYRAPTPSTLAGARVLTTAEAEALWRSGGAVFVDVLPRPPRPAALPAGTVWRDAPHDSVPGAHWLPNVGFGALDAGTERYFLEGLTALTSGDQQANIVIFCLKDCWMSWNAAKRAIAAGYARVAWFPEGLDGWKAAGLPVATLDPWQPDAAR